MKPPLRLSLLLFFLFVSAIAQAQQNFLDITKYEVYYGWAHNYPQDWIVLRRFENRNKEYYLLVNPQTLQTKVNESSFYQVKPMSLADTRTAFKKAPYEKALRKAEKQSVSIQDAGIERGIPTEAGVSLTADLCPSHKHSTAGYSPQCLTNLKRWKNLRRLPYL